MQPTRDGEIDQWRVAFDAACESEPIDMESFEVCMHTLNQAVFAEYAYKSDRFVLYCFVLSSSFLRCFFSVVEVGVGTKFIGPIHPIF